MAASGHANSAEFWEIPGSGTGLHSTSAYQFYNEGIGVHCIVGKIGENGEPFVIGNESIFIANTSGTLYAGLNDSNYGDNSGMAIVRVFSITGKIDENTPTTEPGGYSSSYIGKAIQLNLNTQWTPIVYVEQSDTLLARILGMWMGNSMHPNRAGAWILPGSSGYNSPSNAPFPDFAYGIIVGKIGENGEPFPIDNERKWVADTSGTLYAGINDTPLSDNGGLIIMKVYSITEKINEYSPLSVYNNSNLIPDSPYLQQNYPNPFNPLTNIKYSVDKIGIVQINIYDLKGRIIRTLVKSVNTPGDYMVTWDGTNEQGKIVSSGTYFFQINIDGFSSSKKMLLLK